SGVSQGEHVPGRRRHRLPVPTADATAASGGAVLLALRWADLAGRRSPAPRTGPPQARWPMNISAFLICDRCDAPTIHVFSERRPQPLVLGEIAYVDLIYECDSCGRNRVWESEPRQTNGVEERFDDAGFVHAVEE